MILFVNPDDLPGLDALLDTLAELEARGLVSVEENDLGELRVATTQAGRDAMRDYEQHAPAPLVDARAHLGDGDSAARELDVPLPFDESPEGV